MYQILVADTIDLEMRFIQRVLSRYAQYQVIGCAGTRLQLFSLAGRSQPDILILDTEFNDGDWVQIAVSMRRLFGNLVIILNGLYPDFFAAQQAIALGVNAYLIKPFTEDRLIETLNLIEHQQNKNLKSPQIPSEKDGYPYLSEARLLKNLKEGNRNSFSDEAAQYIFDLEKAYRGQDFRPYVCQLFFHLRWQLEQMGLASSLIAILDTDLYVKEVAFASGFKDITKSIHLYAEQIIRLLVSSEDVQPSCTTLVINYIQEHYRDKITLDDLSRRFHFSPTHIARCIKRSVGKSLNAYINSLRVEKAVELIVKTDLPIFKIALATGYANVPHFNRVFRDLRGLSPTQLRESERHGFAPDI